MLLGEMMVFWLGWLLLCLFVHQLLQLSPGSVSTNSIMAALGMSKAALLSDPADGPSALNQAGYQRLTPTILFQA